MGVGLEFSGRVQSMEGLQSYWAVALPKQQINKQIKQKSKKRYPESQVRKLFSDYCVHALVHAHSHTYTHSITRTIHVYPLTHSHTARTHTCTHTITHCHMCAHIHLHTQTLT